MASDSRVAGTSESSQPRDKGGPDQATQPKAEPSKKTQPAASERPADKAAQAEASKPGAKDRAQVAKGKDAGDAKATKPVTGERRESEPKRAEAGKAKAADASKAGAKKAGPKKTGNGKTKTAPAASKKPDAERTQRVTSEPAKSAAPDEPDEPDDADESQGILVGHRFLLFNAVPSWLVSMVVHAALLMILALITLPDKGLTNQIVAISNPDQVENIEEEDLDVIDPVNVEAFENQRAPDATQPAEAPEVVPDMQLEEVEPAPEKFKLDKFGEEMAPRDDLLDRLGGGTGEGLKGVRGPQGRQKMLKKYGGSEGSEAAVAAALKWLAEHQQRDGGWSFDHQKGACKGRCNHPGLIPEARNGATAMALLPFLGAGQTHKEGKYKKTVEAGLVYLVKRMKVRNGMGDLTDKGGRMYSHGLASIALCEAYAMTNDHGLMQPAQLALNYIVYAQDPVGGGWRYQAKQAGDTSVVGWQLMACKSGHMAYLRVPPETIRGATKFLNFVQTDGGASYGYTVPGAGQATSAVGLLCRMYLGWKHDNPALKAGVEKLSRMGPTDNMYYNYYATQVMRHYGGPHWKEWNDKLRDRLVNAQDTKGHAKGSWFFARAPHGDRGGRLYCTSMATMILEVYYRHMPIYGAQAAEEDFPL